MTRESLSSPKSTKTEYLSFFLQHSALCPTGDKCSTTDLLWSSWTRHWRSRTGSATIQSVGQTKGGDRG